MFDLILYAIPVFAALLGVEWASFRRHPAPELRGYELRDTATSLAMGIGNVIINTGWKLVVLAVYAGVYELTPLRISSNDWWAWPLLFAADDLAFYCYHRASHEVRVFWGSHVVHHSSQHYNLSTALRQPWVPMTAFPFWIPLAALGFPPWMIVLEQAISLTYQFFLHTERVHRLPRAIEAVFNTPSHHRVHHGSNAGYLDRNYGGILIVWDRLLGSFTPETEPVRYGLTKNIDTHNPVWVALHEYADMWRLARRCTRWRDRLGVALHGPGWSPPSGEPRRDPGLAVVEDRA